MARRRMRLAAGDLASVGTARRAVAKRLLSWRCADRERALLVFDELVTNAVVHADGATHIDVRSQGGRVRLDVHDASHAVPARRSPDPDGHGSGLWIVEQLVVDWGFEQTATGKVVWARVEC